MKEARSATDSSSLSHRAAASHRTQGSPCFQDGVLDKIRVLPQSPSWANGQKPDSWMWGLEDASALPPTSHCNSLKQRGDPPAVQCLLISIYVFQSKVGTHPSSETSASCEQQLTREKLSHPVCYLLRALLGDALDCPKRFVCISRVPVLATHRDSNTQLHNFIHTRKHTHVHIQVHTHACPCSFLWLIVQQEPQMYLLFSHSRLLCDLQVPVCH